MKIKSNRTIKQLTDKLIWQSPKIPDDFTLIVDSSETLPLFQTPIDGLRIVRKSLYIGDYSILGFEDKIVVERKMQSDFLAFITAMDSKKTNKTTRFKLEAMGNMDWAALVIEVDSPFEISRFSNVGLGQIRGFLASVDVKYSNITTYYNRDRAELEYWILDRLLYYYKLKREI